MHYLGLNGMPRRIYTYASEFGWGELNMLASLGYLVIFLGTLLFMWNLVISLRKQPDAGHDPWDAPGLEWSIVSPPPVYNFAEIPQVEGQDQYWIMKRRAAAEGQPITEPEALVDPSTIHMPSPSYWPLVTAIGALVLASGMLVDVGWPVIRFPIPILGGFIVFIGIIGWANEPAAAEHPGDEHHGEEHLASPQHAAAVAVMERTTAAPHTVRLLCSNCGNQLSSAFRFCPYCGGTVENPAEPNLEE
jgi:cytochrome c oxidase subunit 1